MAVGCLPRWRWRQSVVPWRCLPGGASRSGKPLAFLRAQPKRAVARRRAFLPSGGEVHGCPVYRDVTAPPYASAYFNWAFYVCYGVIVRPVVLLLGDSRLPLLGHGLTGLFGLAGAGGGVWAGYQLQKDAAQRLAAAAVGAFLFFGPLVAWWGLTVRPGWPVLLIEAIGLGMFLLLASPSSVEGDDQCVGDLLRRLVVQIHLARRAGCRRGVSLIHRRWSELGVLGGGSVILWALTLAFGSPGLWAASPDTATNNTFSLSVGAANLLTAVRALAPVLVGLPWWLHALWVHQPWRRRSFSNDALTLASVGLCALFRRSSSPTRSSAPVPTTSSPPDYCSHWPCWRRVAFGAESELASADLRPHRHPAAGEYMAARSMIIAVAKPLPG